jgi:hypothetical protein
MQMINPTKKDIGRAVIYYNQFEQKERGILLGFNNEYVFVRYSFQSIDSDGQATKREHLVWENPCMSDDF